MINYENIYESRKHTNLMIMKYSIKRLTFLLFAGHRRCFFTFAKLTISHISTSGWLINITYIFLMKLFNAPGILQIGTIVTFLTKTYSGRVDKISTRTIRVPYKQIESMNIEVWINVNIVISSKNFSPFNGLLNLLFLMHFMNSASSLNHCWHEQSDT